MEYVFPAFPLRSPYTMPGFGKLLVGPRNEAYRRMEERLTPYRLRPDWLLQAVGDPDHLYPGGPWAVVLLDKEYKLGQFVSGIREEDPTAFAMCNYGALLPRRSGGGMRLSYVPVLVIRRPSDLCLAPDDGGLIGACRTALLGLEARHSWLALLDPLPPDWVSDRESVASDDFEDYATPLPRPLAGMWHCW